MLIWAVIAGALAVQEPDTTFPTSSCVDLESCEQVIEQISDESWLLQPYIEQDPRPELLRLISLVEESGPSGFEMLMEQIEVTPDYVSIALGHALVFHPQLADHHVPELLRISRRSPRSGATIALGFLATPEALDYLIDDASVAESDMAYSALGLSGDAGFSRVREIVETRYLQSGSMEARAFTMFRSHRVTDPLTPAASQISEQVHEQLVLDALNANAPDARRLSALRAIKDFRVLDEEFLSRLLPLGTDPNREVRTFAIDTLIALGIGDYAAEYIADCQPRDWTDFVITTDRSCRLNDLYHLGREADPAGPALVPLLASENLPFREEVIKTLGALQYEPAIPDLITRLNSRHWGESAWAAWALRRTQAEAGRAALERMLPSVRNPVHAESLSYTLENWDEVDGFWIGLSNSTYAEIAIEQCPTGEFAWRDDPIMAPSGYELPIETGEIDENEVRYLPVTSSENAEGDDALWLLSGLSRRVGEFEFNSLLAYQPSNGLRHGEGWIITIGANLHTDTFGNTHRVANPTGGHAF